PPLDDDVPRQLGGEQRERFSHDRLHMHRDALAESAAAEREDALDERVTALAGDHDAFDVAPQPTAGTDIAKRHLSITEYRAEEVVEVVRDAAGKRTERFQALSLAQLALHPLQIVCGDTAIGYIEHEAHDTLRFAFGVEERPPFRLEPSDWGVGIDHPIFSIEVPP